MWAGAAPPLLSSFSLAALEAAREAAPELPRGLLFEAPPPDWQQAFRRLACYSLHCSRQCLTPQLLDEAWSAGIPMLVYTVNDPEDAGLLLRRGVQFHWLNRGYRDFADFLDGFAAQKRKKVKRERRAVAEAGLRIEARHGDEIDAPLWRAIHRHYCDTFLRHGNHPAFPPEFFQRAAAALGRRMVVFLAWQDERPVASAICYRDDTALYGRHWGADIDCPGLHFELCYYRGIEYALEHGLARFEPGAQGEHKLARGFEPVPTWSAYWIADPRMRGIVANFLAREGEAMQDYEAETARHLPYKSQSP